MVIFYGPYKDLITGQQMAFRYFYVEYKGGKRLIDCGVEKFCPILKVFVSAWIALSSLKYIFLKDLNCIYATLSRSRMGFYRDLLCLMPLLLVRKVRFVNHLHGADFLSFYHSLSVFERVVLRWFYGKVTDSVVLCDAMKKEYKDFPDMRLHVVENFSVVVDDSRCLKEVRSNGGRLTLCFISNLMYSKGVIVLLDAFGQCVKQGLDADLKIAGPFASDEYMSSDDVKELFHSKLKTFSGIEYLGPVYGDDKDSLLEEADVFVFPTFYKTEAQPLVVIEAFSHGCAVISTKHNYMDDLVKERNGVLSSPNDVYSLATEIMKLASDRSLIEQLQETNREEAKVRFSSDRYINELTGIVNIEVSDV